MTCFIRILTALAILVHTTVGCCAHGPHTLASAEAAYDHADGLPPDQYHVGAHYHGDDCAGHVDYYSAASEWLGPSCHCRQQSLPPVPHECCRVTCKWPARELRESVDLLILSAPIEFESDRNTAMALVLIASGVGSMPFLDSLPPTLPVRSHLAKCVFLI